MATVNLILFKGKKLKNNSYPVMIQIIHNREVRRVALGYSATEHEWDDTAKEFTRRKANYKWLNNKIKHERNDYEATLLKMEENKEDLSIDKLISILKGRQERGSFLKFTKQLIDDMIKSRKVGNAAIYRQVSNILSTFQEGKDLMFDDITYNWLKDFEVYHLSKGNTMNGLDVYIRTMKAIYNKAIKAGIIKAERYPFGKYKIKVTKPKKRAISKTDIDKIKFLELPYNTPLWHSKNYFLFCFYSRGMNWVDMAFLTLENISDGRINYKRAKTGKEYSIKITDQIRDILDYYISQMGTRLYIFPFLKRPHDPVLAKKDVDNSRKKFNKYLKRIGQMCNIEKKITTYVSRHSWGTIGFKELNIPIGIISQGYGHEDIKTTQIYLEEFDVESLDNANDQITK